MFAEFFYLLRARGLDVSISEWLTLLEALSRGLHRSSLTGFYQLCRMVLVKDEADYDRFDRVFLEFFRDVPWDGELPPELLEWLEHPMEDLGRTIADLRRQGVPDETLEQLMARLEERLKEQTEEHNGGNYWVGTQGRSPFGNSGVHPGGIRIGGTGQHRTAVSVAGERRFRDFRGDATLDDSRFQTAFRLLRQMSFQSDGEPEVDVDGTIHDTCDHGGTLTIRYRRPRKNAVKSTTPGCAAPCSGRPPGPTTSKSCMSITSTTASMTSSIWSPPSSGAAGALFRWTGCCAITTAAISSFWWGTPPCTPMS